MIAVGFTFLGRNRRYPTEHLNIIISPCCDGGKIIYVNATTKKESSDTTCILKRDDHAWLTHKYSVINYHDTTETELRLIEEAIRIKLFTAHDPVSNALLKRIQQGALVSPAFPPKYLKYIPAS